MRDYELIGVVKSYDKQKKEVTLIQRNRFFKGDKLEILMANGPYIEFYADKMTNEKGEEIEVAPHPNMLVTIPCNDEVLEGSFIRKKRV